jgi:hemerythrin-like domain-containing protein
MRTTEILMEEHRVIERVLACIERIADDAEAKHLIDVASATDAILFMRTFADACHHAKEEERLFPAMERFGLPKEVGPTAVMRQEHEMGRGHVRAMDAAVAAAANSSAGAVERFVAESRALVELLRAHITKEDQILFPMADRMLPPDVQDELLRGFAHAELHEMGEGTHERFLSIADQLEARWGIMSNEVRAKPHTCACSHEH